jgi:RNA polymerase sigma factor for flagellar operon FliA
VALVIIFSSGMAKKIDELSPEQRARVDDPQNMALIKQIAHHLASRMPPNVHVEDLMQAGFIGLVDAAEKYDPAKGAEFKTYAGIRIRGAMIDEVRQSDWGSRNVFRIAREAERILSEDHNKEKGPGQHKTRHAAYTEAATAVLGDSSYSRSRERTILGAMEGGRLLSLEQAAGTEVAEEPSHGIWGANLTPPEIIERDQEDRRVTQAISKLPQRLRSVIERNAGGKNLREIADEEGKTESLICQKRKQALGMLRNTLGIEDDAEPQHSR